MIKKENNMSNENLKGTLWEGSDGWETFSVPNKEDDKCSECGKIPAKIEYKDKKYCTWYCAKKESK